MHNTHISSNIAKCVQTVSNLQHIELSYQPVTSSIQNVRLTMNNCTRTQVTI